MRNLENFKIFRKQVEEKIKDFSKEQKVFFTCLCAVRSFPFWGASYLKNSTTNIVMYTYSIINAIDVAYSYIVLKNYIPRSSQSATFFVVNSAAANAANAAHSAANAAFYAYIDNADDVTNAATNAAVYAAYAAYEYYNINLNNTILNDIIHIKLDNYDKLNNDISLYGDLWGQFQSNFKQAGLKYWANLYADIFKNRFNPDKEALKLRLSVPQEIQQQGALAVARYLKELESRGGKNLNEARIIILGEKGAGKTCLARRFIDPTAPIEHNESTRGVVTTDWKVGKENNTVNVHIWDFAGHVITHAAHRCFLSERCLYVIVYNGRTETENRLNYWLDHVKNYGGNAPVRILINLFDNHKPDIPVNTLKKNYPFIQDFVYFSIENDQEDLKKFRSSTSEYIVNNPMWNCQQIPKNYYDIKNNLEGLFKDSRKEYIPIEYFENKAKKFGIDTEKEQQQLLEVLHYLGISLWYKNIEGFNTLILNPDWLANGIYETINWAFNNGKNTIAITDYNAVFGNENTRYPVEKFEDIFRLMEKYELAFPKGENEIVVPHLLREDCPDKLPDFPIEASLMIKYVSDQSLPPNTVCRLIVRHHNEIRSNTEVWRYGVILKDKGTLALVQEEDRYVTITVKGLNKSEYISKLRNTMNDIFSSYKSDKPELQYRIVEHSPREIQGYEEILLSHETIIAYYENGRLFFNPKSKSDINLAPIVQIYNIKEIIMGNKFKFEQGSNVGLINAPSDNATGTAYQINNNVDYQAIMNDIEKIKEYLRKQEQNDDNDILIGEITEIKKAAKDKDEKMIHHKLKSIGTKLLNIAEQVGCSMLASYIMGYLSPIG